MNPRLASLTRMVRWIPLLAVVACSPTTDSPPAAPQRVENVELDLAIAALPGTFEVATNRGARLELRAVGDGGPAVVTIEVGPEETGGINLVALAKGAEAWFGAQPEGEYFGNLELVTPLGSAFTARGSYSGPSGAVEELHVFTLHPRADRLLKLVYRYAPGEGRERMQQMAELLGELEAPPGQDQDASSSADDS